MKTLRNLLGISTLLAGCASLGSYSTMQYIETLKGRPLKPYVQCQCIDSLHIVAVNAGNPNAPKFRVANGDTISVVDGFRVIYAFNALKYPFVRLMAEQSDPTKYESDKAKVTAFIKKSSQEASFTGMFDSTINGFQVIGTERNAIDQGNIIGIYNVFSNVDHAIVTIYFQNQQAEGRVFRSITEFKALRSEFIHKYTACIAKRDPTTPLSL